MRFAQGLLALDASSLRLQLLRAPTRWNGSDETADGDGHETAAGVALRPAGGNTPAQNLPRASPQHPAASAAWAGVGMSRPTIRAWLGGMELVAGMERSICLLAAVCRRRLACTERRLGHSRIELLLNQSAPQLGGSLAWHHSCRSLSKVTLFVGSDASSLTLLTERTLNRASCSAVGLALHLSPRGFSLKLRMERFGHRLLVPVYLATSPHTLSELLLASLAAAIAGTAACLLLQQPQRAHRALLLEESAVRTTWDAAQHSAVVELRLLEREAAARCAH